MLTEASIGGRPGVWRKKVCKVLDGGAGGEWTAEHVKQERVETAGRQHAGEESWVLPYQRVVDCVSALPTADLGL